MPRRFDETIGVLGPALRAGACPSEAEPSMHGLRGLAGGVERRRSERSRPHRVRENNAHARLTSEHASALRCVLALKLQWMRDMLAKQGAEIEELVRGLDGVRTELRARAEALASQGEPEA